MLGLRDGAKVDRCTTGTCEMRPSEVAGTDAVDSPSTAGRRYDGARTPADGHLQQQCATEDRGFLLQALLAE